MPHDGQDLSAQAAGDTTPVLPDLLALTGAAIGPCETVLETARDRVRGMVAEGGKVSGALIEAHQTAAHGPTVHSARPRRSSIKSPSASISGRSTAASP